MKLLLAPHEGRQRDGQRGLRRDVRQLARALELPAEAQPLAGLYAEAGDFARAMQSLQWAEGSRWYESTRAEVDEGLAIFEEAIDLAEKGL